MPSRAASLRRPDLPSRRPSSGASALPPADAAKPDDEAIDDVYLQVDATGSLEAAAKKLAEIAADGPGTAVQRRHEWWNDPEEQEYLAQYEDEGDEEDEEEYEIEHINEVVDGLWIGDLVAAMDVDGLRERGISNVVSLLRPRLEFSPEFSSYAVEIDDAEETDILTHLPSTTAWIQEALDRRAGVEVDERSKDIKVKAETKPGGVLVHCQAGMSRSATVVCAYLMRELGLDPVEAVTFLRERRPVVDPSETFWHQMGLYYLADGRVNLKDRTTRQWYLERTTGLVMNDGIKPSTEHMAKYPATPSASRPQTPMGSARRKIRCKMCRQHLALREHMMDHILDQTPLSRRTSNASAMGTPAGLGMTNLTPDDEAIDLSEPASRSRRPSVASEVINPLTGLPASRSRRPSEVSLHTPDTLSRPRTRSILGGGFNPEALAMTRADSSASVDKDKDDKEEVKEKDEGRKILTADQLAARLPPHLAALRAAQSPSNSTSLDSSPEREKEKEKEDKPSLATRRRASSSLSMTFAHPLAGLSLTTGPAPIIVNPKCSGYFVEPLTWMEGTIGSGEVSGKLLCPNPKCGVKIGNYDWAGVMCGCREWVTPGFCLARSKVEEVW